MAYVSNYNFSATLKTKGFEDGLDKISRKQKKFVADTQKDTKTLGGFVSGLSVQAAAIGAAVGAGLAAIGKMTSVISDNIEQISKLKDVADQYNSTAKGLQEWTYAAEKNGATVDDVTTAYRELQKSLTEVFDGSEKAYGAFNQLGIKLSEIVDLPADEQLNKIAEALNQIEDKNVRVSLRNELLGKGSAKLSTTLTNKNADLSTAPIGAILPEEAIANIKEADEALERLKKSFEGIKNVITVAVAPSITEFANYITKAVGDSNDDIHSFISVLLQIGGTVLGIAQMIDHLIIGIGYLLTPIAQGLQWLITRIVSALALLGGLILDMVKNLAKGIEIVTRDNSLSNKIAEWEGAVMDFSAKANKMAENIEDDFTDNTVNRIKTAGNHLLEGGKIFVDGVMGTMELPQKLAAGYENTVKGIAESVKGAKRTVDDLSKFFNKEDKKSKELGLEYAAALSQVVKDPVKNLQSDNPLFLADKVNIPQAKNLDVLKPAMAAMGGEAKYAETIDKIRDALNLGLFPATEKARQSFEALANVIDNPHIVESQDEFYEANRRVAESLGWARDPAEKYQQSMDSLTMAYHGQIAALDKMVLLKEDYAARRAQLDQEYETNRANLYNQTLGIQATELQSVTDKLRLLNAEFKQSPNAYGTVMKDLVSSMSSVPSVTSELQRKVAELNQTFKDKPEEYNKAVQGLWSTISNLPGVTQEVRDIIDRLNATFKDKPEEYNKAMQSLWQSLSTVPGIGESAKAILTALNASLKDKSPDVYGRAMQSLWQSLGGVPNAAQEAKDRIAALNEAFRSGTKDVQAYYGAIENYVGARDPNADFKDQLTRLNTMEVGAKEAGTYNASKFSQMRSNIASQNGWDSGYGQQQANIEKLDLALKNHVITQQQYNIELGNLKANFNDLSSNAQGALDTLSEVDYSVDRFAQQRNQAMAGANELLAKGKINAEQYEALLDRITVKYSEWGQIGDTLASSMETAMMSMLMSAKSFGDAMKNLLKEILAEIIRVMIVKQLATGITNAIMGAMGGLSGGGGADSVGSYGGGATDLGGGIDFGGYAAEGGPVEAGNMYMVNEKGQEFFLPSTSGNIITNEKLKKTLGASMNEGPKQQIVQNFTFQAYDVEGMDQAINRWRPKLQQDAILAVQDASGRRKMALA